MERQTRGEFASFMEERTKDPSAFYGAYRMSSARFDEILEVVGPQLERQHTNFRKPISPAERLAITIRFVVILLLLLLFFIHISVQKYQNFIQHTYKVIQLIFPMSGKWRL